MENRTQTHNDRSDLVLGCAVALAAFVLYLNTLAPSVAFLFDDTLEYQYVIPKLGIIHQTGYPFFTLLGKSFTLIVPLNDPAFRLNLLSAVNGALAVLMVYYVIRHLTKHRFAAPLGAITFAVGQTFWSQAVIAESYTTQMLIVSVLLYLVLVWKEETERGNQVGAQRRLYLLAFVMGLGLTHHRLIALLYPALAVYVVWVNPKILLDWQRLIRAAAVFVLPLLLYLYLPLRGAVGSADGTYQNTWQGFWEWVLAQQYTVFLTGNPFQVQRDAAYYSTLFQNQFGVLGLVLAVVGLVWLLQRQREWVLIVVALVVQAIFVFNYHVANVYVHFLTIFLLCALLVGIGTDGLLDTLGNLSSRRRLLSAGARFLFAILALLIPVFLFLNNYNANDLSAKWDVHDYGLDVLNQPLEPRATIIGIQGEVTLLRYFQETAGLRPDVQTIAADKEEARLAAVDQSIREGRAVYLTRPLKGIETKYSLASAGPLIRVQAKAEQVLEISHPLDEDLNQSVRLLGYDLDMTKLGAVPGRWHAENGRQLLVTLYWKPVEKIADDAMVSIKLLDKNHRVMGQLDRRPVLDAYPTTAWRAGEAITDTFAVPVFLGTPPGDYVLHVTLYNSQSGIVLGQRDLQSVKLGPDLVTPRRDTWNIAHHTDSEVGEFELGGFELDGYSLDVEGLVRPGDALPITLLWHAGNSPIPNNAVSRFWLEDSTGQVVASRDAPLGNGFPVSLWQPNQYVRDWPVVRVPANVADGKYVVKLAVARNNLILGVNGLPFGSSAVQLGTIDIQNRPRVMDEPAVPNPMEVTFDKKFRLLGYELTRDIPQRGVRLTLFWKSLALTDTSYSVFIHLIDGNSHLIMSADGLPGDGNLPTTGWIENEYISDIHAFTLPAELPEGGLPIEIGLYNPANGARLKTTDGQDRLILTSIDP